MKAAFGWVGGAVAFYLFLSVVLWLSEVGGWPRFAFGAVLATVGGAYVTVETRRSVR
jgi:hypothetical protein